MKLTGLLWWIDRWRQSSAYSAMTLEQQGAYRNLLDEMWLRGGTLPNNPKLLAKASGDPLRWPALRPVVMKWFQKTRRAWTHDTLLAVRNQSVRRARNQHTYYERQKSLNRGLNRGLNADNKPASLDLDLGSTKTPLPPFGKGGRLTRGDLQMAKMQRARVFGGCPHAPRCENYAACVAQLAREAKVRES